MNDPKSVERESQERLRILLTTKTHYVPGKDYAEKVAFTKNTICQHLWKRDFDQLQERWYPYNSVFGLADRECFFLIDHFGFDHTIHEEQQAVSVLWYAWDGNSLVQVHEDLPATLQAKLKKWPFTWEGRKFHRLPKNPDGTWSPTDMRGIVQSFLRLGIPLPDDQIKFIKEYPEHTRWLKDNLEEHLWLKLEPYTRVPLDKEETRTGNQA